MKPKELKMVADRIVLLTIFFCSFFFSYSQKNEAPDTTAILPASHASINWLNVRNIVITGNRKTKEYIIKREMEIKTGDSILIPNLTKRLEAAKINVYNTLLFVSVKVEPIIINAFQIDIIVTVKEKIYVFPVPQFQLVDRSFDEWLVKHNGSLSRVNYGVNFSHFNLTGRKDLLQLSLTNGYTRNVSVYYNSPYSNSKLTAGFYGGIGYSQTREIAYKTNYDNSYAYYKNGGFVRNSWNILGGYIIRKAIIKSEIISASFTHMSVTDSILSPDFNPGYFNSRSAVQDIPDIAYTIRYTNVNNILFPLTGKSGYISFQKRGFGLSGGINMFSIEGEYDKYISLGRKWYTSMQYAGKIKLPFNQSYINLRALGDRDALRGLEYYTIDGVAYATAKYNLKREILNFVVPTFLKSKTYNKIPFKIYAKFFTDFGYVYARDNSASRLSNKLLSTAGIGLDILTLYDIHIRLDYSLNQLGQKRIAINNKTGF